MGWIQTWVTFVIRCWSVDQTSGMITSLRGGLLLVILPQMPATCQIHVQLPDKKGHPGGLANLRVLKVVWLVSRIVKFFMIDWNFAMAQAGCPAFENLFLAELESASLSLSLDVWSLLLRYFNLAGPCLAERSRARLEPRRLFVHLTSRAVASSHQTWYSLWSTPISVHWNVHESHSRCVVRGCGLQLLYHVREQNMVCGIQCIFTVDATWICPTPWPQ